MFWTIFAITPLGKPTTPSLSSGVYADESGLFWYWANNPMIMWVLIGIGLLIVIMILIIIVQIIVRRKYKKKYGMTNIVMKITLQKYSEAQNQDSAQFMQDSIAYAEMLFLSIGGLKPKISWKSRFFGREDTVACEIVMNHGRINFYFVVPANLKSYIEENIHATYPDARVEDVTDYNIFRPDSIVKGAYLKLSQSYIFPIKSYKKMEADPLTTIVSGIARLNPKNEGAAIQFIMRSAHKSWHNSGDKVAREMSQGKRIDQAMRDAGIGKTGVDSFVKITGKLGDVLTPSSLSPQLEGQKSISLSQQEQEMAKNIQEKSSKAGLDLNVRVVVSGTAEGSVDAHLQNIINAFSQYAIYQYGNMFQAITMGSSRQFVSDFIHRRFDEHFKLIVNVEEMATLFHFPLPNNDVPAIEWMQGKKPPPPSNIPNEGILLGHVEYQGKDIPIRIDNKDRMRHMYFIGKSGTGKSVLLQNLVIQDIRNGNGVCVVDPHGDLIDGILANIPKERADDVIVFDPADLDRPMSLNLLDINSPAEADMAALEATQIFIKIFGEEIFSPRLQHYFRNGCLTLMENPEYGATLIDIPRLFTDPKFTEEHTKNVKNPAVRDFWENEYAQTGDREKQEMIPYFSSKFGPFVTNKIMRNVIGQRKSSFNFEQIMNEKKILLVSLSKGKIGDANMALLGLILVSKLQMVALSRASMSESERKDFYLYMDEFQNFVTDSIGVILSEARKYKLGLIIAHQYLAQLIKGNDTKIKDAVFGNVGTMGVYRIGVEDAEEIAKEFDPIFTAYDLMNPDAYTINIKTLINSVPTNPFNMIIYPPQSGNPELVKALRELSRFKYGRPKEIVDHEVADRLGFSI